MKFILILLSLFSMTNATAQDKQAEVSGTVTYNGDPIPFANIYVKNGTNGTSTDIDGKFTLNVPSGTSAIVVQSQGFRTQTKQISSETEIIQEVNFSLVEDVLGLEEVVVSATRNRISKKEAPVIVNVLSPKLFQANPVNILGRRT
jgi:outer membrane receptor for ferrienterochelin and colicins